MSILRVKMQTGPLLLHYRSALDDTDQPYILNVPSGYQPGQPTPLILFLHGNMGPGVSAERFIAWAQAASLAWGADAAVGGEVPYLHAQPFGRGNTRYNGPGERDVFDMIEDMKARYSVDEDRIYLTGASMGGAGTWYLTSHYPDRFAAAAPMCGYCDHRLWQGAGDPPLPTWEEAIWAGKEACYLAENYCNLPIYPHHGDLDLGIGGGVSVEHSRRFVQRLKDLGYPVRYKEYRGLGHAGFQPDDIPKVVRWLLSHRRDAQPVEVVYKTVSLRCDRAYWVRMDDLEQGGKFGIVRACAGDGNRIDLRCDGVTAVAVTPPDRHLDLARPVAITVNGRRAFEGKVEEGEEVLLRKGRDRWGPSEPVQGLRKRHGVSGPIGDVMWDRFLYVAGTKGGKGSQKVLHDLAHDARRGMLDLNGGIHSGGIPGRLIADLKVVRDADVTEDDLRRSHLILFGTPRTNRIVARIAKQLPVTFLNHAVALGGREFAGDDVGVRMIYPNPLNPDRYVVLNAGVTEQALVYASRRPYGLMPDYFVWNGPKVLAWGYFNADWQV